MKTAVLTFSPHGMYLAQYLLEKEPSWELFLHSDLQKTSHLQNLKASYFTKVSALWQENFHSYKNWVCIAPTGAIVRAMAPLIIHKLKDPAVVVVDAGGRYALSLLSGHEGGANLLAIQVANHLECEPCIGTTTEAVKNIIAGIGCRKNTPKEAIREALEIALNSQNLTTQDLRYLATAEIKSQEKGLLEFAQEIQVPLRIISHADLHRYEPLFGTRESVMNKVGLPGVAEPTALLAGRRTELCLKRIAHQGVTIALAKENCMWSGSDLAASWIEAFGPFKV